MSLLATISACRAPSAYDSQIISVWEKEGERERESKGERGRESGRERWPIPESAHYLQPESERERERKTSSVFQCFLTLAKS